MKVEVFLNPYRFNSEDYERYEWMESYIDSSYEYDNWFKKLSSAVSYVYNTQKNELETYKSAKSCPAFISGFKNRIVVRNLADLNVNNYNNENKIFSSHPYGLKNHIEFHDETQLGKEFPFPKGKSTNPVKFLSPYWFCFSETVDLIYNPIWWTDTSYIEAIPAVIRVPRNKPIPLNINCFIKTPEKEENYVIPKGKELCQIIFAEVKKPKIKFNRKINKKFINKALNNKDESASSRVSSFKDIKEHVVKDD